MTRDEKLEMLELMRQVVREETVGLRADIATLQTDVTELKTDVATLKTDVAQLKNDVIGLKNDQAKMWQVIRNLEDKVDREISNIKMHLIRLEDKVDREISSIGEILQFIMHHYDKELAPIKERLADTENDMNRLEKRQVEQAKFLTDYVIDLKADWQTQQLGHPVVKDFYKLQAHLDYLESRVVKLEA